MTILDPTAADVKRLDDVQLRELVARLAAADLRGRGEAETGVSAGGDQRAGDGGIDVSVAGDSQAAGDMLPRLPLGFQVKATAMRGQAITREMRPKGQLRPAIVALAMAGGAYVIACGRDDLSASALDRAVTAMRAALGDEANLLVDFYDASRLARWAAQFPGEARWLLACAGRPSGGWRHLGPWSTPGDEPRPYLVDESARLIRGRGTVAPTDILSGLSALRQVLAVPGLSARLIGLSGMGKTRLAEAAFDPVVGEALPSSWVVYGDAGSSPEVTPASMAQHLVDIGRRCVLIVDNCPAALHTVLTGIVRASGSAVSLLTIDFDVGDAQPEHTTVFRLARAGDPLIDALLRQRAPVLTSGDRDRVANFCDGNTRIALVLAQAATTGGSLTGLSDPELLDKLFLDARRGPDKDLRTAAGVAALVNAFEVDGPIDQSEAAWLAQFAGLNPMTFLAKIGDLLERGMAQQRGVQRAILPPAIAVWMAEETLGRLPPNVIINHMVTRAPPRLARSFARRLAMLNPIAPVAAIARQLLSPGGRFSAPSDLLGDEMSVVNDLAHLAPAEALAIARDTIDRMTPQHASARQFLARNRLVDLLHGLAHDAKWFDPAVDLLACLACAEPPESNDRIEDRILQFFQLSHAGTTAPNARRIRKMDSWLNSPDPGLSALGLKALGAALKFQPRHVFPRTVQGGIAPYRTASFATAEERDAWISGRLDRLVDVAANGRAPAARAIFLGRFDALVRRDHTRAIALATFERLEAMGPWREAWFAVCRALARLKPDARTPDLRALETRLRPIDLTARFDVWLYADWYKWEDPEGLIEDEADFGRQQAEQVGVEAVAAPEGEALLKRSLEDPQVRGFAFGAGFARAHQDKMEGWDRLMCSARTIKIAPLCWPTVGGYLNETRKESPELADRWLDELLADPQTTVPAFLIVVSGQRHKDRDLERILSVLQKATDPAILDKVWWARPDDSASDLLIARIVEALLDRGIGRQALDFLDSRLQAPADRPWAPALVAAGRRLVAEIHDEAEEDDIRDYRLSRLIRHAVKGPEGAAAAGLVLQRLHRRALDPRSALQSMPETMAVLSQRYPTQTLDEFLLGGDEAVRRSRVERLFRAFVVDDDEEPNALAGAPLDAVLDWVRVDPAVRGELAAQVIPFYRQGAEGRPVWTTAMARLMSLCPNEAVLEMLELRVLSGGGDGSLAERMRARRPMLEGLGAHADPAIRTWSEAMLTKLDDWVDWHEGHERERDQRFE